MTFLLCVNTISSDTFMKRFGISSGFFYNLNFWSTKYLSTVYQKKETTVCLKMLRQENQQNYSQKYPISNLKTTSYLCFMFFFRAHLAVVLAQELLKSATRVNDIVWQKRTVHTGSFSLILFHKYMTYNLDLWHLPICNTQAFQ